MYGADQVIDFSSQTQLHCRDHFTNAAINQQVSLYFIAICTLCRRFEGQNFHEFYKLSPPKKRFASSFKPAQPHSEYECAIVDF